jgi:hypothetical protein
MGTIAQQTADMEQTKAFVRVWLDSKASQERGVLLGQLDTAQAEVTTEEEATKDRKVTPKLKQLRDHEAQLRDQLVALEERERDFLHVIEFEKCDGQVWGDLADARPPRENTPIDAQLGYNTRGVAMEAAKLTGSLVLSKDPADRNGPREKLDADDWNALLKHAAPYDLDNIENAVMLVNVYQASNRIARSVKS